MAGNDGAIANVIIIARPSFTRFGTLRSLRIGAVEMSASTRSNGQKYRLSQKAIDRLSPASLYGLPDDIRQVSEQGADVIQQQIEHPRSGNNNGNKYGDDFLE